MYSFMRSSSSARLSASVSMMTRLNRPVRSAITPHHPRFPGRDCDSDVLQHGGQLTGLTGPGDRNSRITIMVSPVSSVVGAASAAALHAIVFHRRHAHHAAHLEQ